MELKLYDTLTREKRVFRPLDPQNVRMYVCGPTVYDFAHIGNARPVIVFDVLFRLLRHLYGEKHVTYVRNITDIDDKINARAAEEYPALPLNEAIRKVTEKTDKQFHEDVAALGCLPPTFEPRATEHIGEMRTLIDQLMGSGNAYVADNHVLFDVPTDPNYGELSKRPLDEMIAGARVEVAPYKENPQDFVLWKPSQPGEPAWPSPARIETPGRPGWHIECSAMAWKYLGETFDIHGGGIDLVFPHHENEIAQSRCAFHTSVMANYWMHNGFLQVEGEKMAKSAGNFVTIHELLKDWPGEVLRLNMLRTHYRQPIDWTLSGLRESATVLRDWKNIVADLTDLRFIKIEPYDDVLLALLDDLNTPGAIYKIHDIYRGAQKNAVDRGSLYANLVFLALVPNELELAKPIAESVRKSISTKGKTDIQISASDMPIVERELERSIPNLPMSSHSNATLTTASLLIFSNPIPLPIVDDWKKYNRNFLSKDDRAHIEQVIGVSGLNERIEARLAARVRKDFAASDRIRDELAKMGVVLKDSKDGTAWEIAR